MNHRLLKVKKELIRKKLDAALVSSIPNIIYLTGFSAFSNHEREAFLLIDNNNQYIFTDGRYKEAVKKTVPDFKLIEISSKSPFKKTFKDFLKKLKIIRLGVEENDLRVSEYKSFLRNFEKIINFNIDTLRATKDNNEILEIEKASKLTDKTFEYILTKIKPEMSEKELAFEIECFIKKNGAGLAFSPIVAFGKNSSVPHHKPGENILDPSTHFVRSGREGQIVLLDFGAKINNYCSDMTRTVFFGKANNEQKRMYKTVLETNQKAIDFLSQQHSNETIEQFSNELKASSVDKAARDYIVSQGFPSIPHSLGHGVGIEIHESPRVSPKSKDVLKPSMVFSIEPGIYLPNLGGVRIEDLIVLNEKGIKILTCSTKDIIEL